MCNKIENNKILLTGIQLISSQNYWKHLKTLFLNKFEDRGFISVADLIVLEPADIHLESYNRASAINLQKVVDILLQMLKDKHAQSVQPNRK